VNFLKLYYVLITFFGLKISLDLLLKMTDFFLVMYAGIYNYIDITIVRKVIEEILKPLTYICNL